jgi:hypothetical protein
MVDTALSALVVLAFNTQPRIAAVVPTKEDQLSTFADSSFPCSVTDRTDEMNINFTCHAEIFLDGSLSTNAINRGNIIKIVGSERYIQHR